MWLIADQSELLSHVYLRSSTLSESLETKYVVFTNPRFFIYIILTQTYSMLFLHLTPFSDWKLNYTPTNSVSHAVVWPYLVTRVK